jgi:hypothetical protein
MKRIFILSALFCLLLLQFTGCSGEKVVDPTINLPIGHVQGINVIPGIMWLEPGETYRFEARGIFPGGAIGDLTFLATWFIDDTTIAQIIGPGLVKAKMAGLAHVYCTYDGVTSSTVTVAVPGVPLEQGIIPVHVEVFPGSLSIPIEEGSNLTFVPDPASPDEITLGKPAMMYALGDGYTPAPDGYWADATLKMTSGFGTGLEFEVINNYTSPDDTDPLDPTRPFGPDWIPDGITVFEIDDSAGFPYDFGIAQGDGYTLSKRWIRFVAIADYSDGNSADVTALANWHLSDPTYGYITPGGLFNSTSAKPTNLVVYCDFSGLVSNYVPISVH